MLACNLLPNSLDCLLCLRSFTLKTSRFRFWIGMYSMSLSICMCLTRSMMSSKWSPRGCGNRCDVALTRMSLSICLRFRMALRMPFILIPGPGRKCISSCTSIYVRRVMSEKFYGDESHISPLLSRCSSPDPTGIKARRRKSMSPSRAPKESEPSGI